MTTEQEREVLKELIEAYKDNPCLWDMASELYRNKEMKHKAWGQLTKILKKLDPDANYCTTKKKMDNFRSCYFRELKKVQTSKVWASDEKDIHRPNLWYYKLISFVGTKEAKSRRYLDAEYADPLQDCDEGSLECVEVSESEAEELEIAPKRKLIRPSKSSKKKRQPIPINKVKTDVEPLRYPEVKYPTETKLKTDSFYERKQQEQKAKNNTFGLYVGEQLDEISSFQRNVAEKLISDVLFLAKTGRLSCDSRIETSRSSRHSSEAAEYIMVSSPTMLEVDAENEKGHCETTLLKELLTEGLKK